MGIAADFNASDAAGLDAVTAGYERNELGCKTHQFFARKAPWVCAATESIGRLGFAACLSGRVFLLPAYCVILHFPAG